MTEPILPKGKIKKVEFECKRCKNTTYLDKKGYDRLSRQVDCRVCKKCGTRYMKEQNQFVPFTEKNFIQIR